MLPQLRWLLLDRALRGLAVRGLAAAQQEVVVALLHLFVALLKQLAVLFAAQVVGVLVLASGAGLRSLSLDVLLEVAREFLVVVQEELLLLSGQAVLEPLQSLSSLAQRRG